MPILANILIKNNPICGKVLYIAFSASRCFNQKQPSDNFADFFIILGDPYEFLPMGVIPIVGVKKFEEKILFLACQ